MANVIQNLFHTNLATKQIDWPNDQVEAIMLASTYTPDKDDEYADITGDEVSGGGYSRLDLSGKTASQDDTLDRLVYSSSSLRWPLSSFTAWYLALNDVTAGNKLIGVWDLGEDQSAGGADLVVSVPADGWMTQQQT